MSPEGARAYALMEEAGISLDRFAAMSGVKASTARTGLSGGRLSNAMRTVLHEIANDLQVKLLVNAAKDEEVLEEDDVGYRMGRVYAIPSNRYLRLVEFKDGSHGKFRTKDGKFGIGSVAKLVEGINGMWEIVGDYDRRSRLRES